MALIEIYYVDDDVDDIEIFTEAVKAIEEKLFSKITIYTFSEGDNLLKAIRKTEPQNAVIFLDINMPVKNGYQVLTEIRQDEGGNINHIPVIMYSTSSNGSSVDKSYELGAHLYAIKPRSFELLKNIIKQVLAINWEKFKTDRDNFIIQT